MQSASDLHKEWTDGDEPGVNPQRVKRLRAGIREYTDYSPPRQIDDIAEWVEEKGEDVAAGLEAAADGESDEEDDADDPLPDPDPAPELGPEEDDE